MPVAPSVSDVMFAISGHLEMHKNSSTNDTTSIDSENRYFASGGLMKRPIRDLENLLLVEATYTFIDEINRFVCYASAKMIGLRNVQVSKYSVNLIESSSLLAKAMARCPIGKLMSINGDILLLVNHNGGNVGKDGETQIAIWLAEVMLSKEYVVQSRMRSWDKQLHNYMTRIAEVPLLEKHRPALQREIDRLKQGDIIFNYIRESKPKSPFSSEDQRRFEVLLLDLRIYESQIESVGIADVHSLKYLYTDWHTYQEEKRQFLISLSKFRREIRHYDQLLHKYPNNSCFDGFRHHLNEARNCAIKYSEDERFTLDLPSLIYDVQKYQEMFIYQQMLDCTKTSLYLRAAQDDALSRASEVEILRQRKKAKQKKYEDASRDANTTLLRSYFVNDEECVNCGASKKLWRMVTNYNGAYCAKCGHSWK